MPIQQTIDIPAHPKGEDLRLTIDVPREVPAGPVILTFTPAPAKEPEPTLEPEGITESEKLDIAARMIGYQDHGDFLRRNSPRTIEEAVAEQERKSKDPKNKNRFNKFYGILEGDAAYGDGMEYQRKMRDEWK
ncbi:hypothetical protein AGMMS4952_13490 [Spirochaetia bacterium]|nr:hypothetical protein AGMMS4952_13490 [Spirochaetia bacterium]